MPLGLAYIGARLESLGYHTDLFDLNTDVLPEDGQYEQLWMSTTAPQIANVKEVGKTVSGWTKTKTCLGGAGVWASPQDFENLGFGMVVAGECDAEDATRKILELVENPNESHYAFFPVKRDLNWVLPPLRRWADRYNAYFTDLQGNTYRATTMFSSRGCGFSCAFCESGRLGVVWSNKVRFEPLDIVEEQIKEAKSQNFDCLAYYDDIAPIQRNRTLALMELHKKYNMKWRGFIRTDLICNNGGREYLQEMKSGGLIEAFIGVESADNAVKDAIQKKTTIEQDTAVVRWARELGIKTKCSFILGLPTESRESIEKTRQWIFAEKPDRVQCGRLIVFKGVPLSSHPEKFDLQYEEQPPDDWYYSGDNGIGTRSFVSTSHLTRDEIDVLWHELMQDIKDAGIPS